MATAVCFTAACFTAACFTTACAITAIPAGTISRAASLLTYVASLILTCHHVAIVTAVATSLLPPGHLPSIDHDHFYVSLPPCPYSPQFYLGFESQVRLRLWFFFFFGLAGARSTGGGGRGSGPFSAAIRKDCGTGANIEIQSRCEGL